MITSCAAAARAEAAPDGDGAATLPPLSREELVARLAEVSHLTYVRQKHRDHGVPLDELTLEVTDHDRERAEDTVAALERLGVYPGTGSGAGPAADAPAAQGGPATAEPEARPITDIWGRPIAPRGRRGR